MALIKKLISGKLSGLVYVASVLASFLVVEYLRKFIGKDSANQYISLLAVTLTAAALSDFGLPGSLQWLLLSNSVKASKDCGPETQYELRKIIIRVKTIFGWVVFGLSGYRRKMLLLPILSVAAALVLAYMSMQMYANAGLIYLLIFAVSINVRKIVCVFMDAMGMFVASRLFAGLSNLLALPLIISLVEMDGVLWVQQHLIELIVFSNLAVAVLGVLFILLFGKWWALPEISKNIGIEQSTKWYMLSIMGVLQSQVFYLVAPFSGMDKFMVPIYYAQKTSQITSELVAQVFKEYLYNWRNNKSGNIKYTLLLKMKTLAFIVAVPVGIILVVFPVNLIGFERVVLIMVAMLESWFAVYFTLCGYVGLMNGGVLPFAAHVKNTLLQLFLVSVATPFLGVIGYLGSNILSGAISTYVANYRLFEYGCSRIETSRQ